MNHLIRFLRIDLTIQVLLIGLAMVTAIFLFPLMITMPLLGIWQIISALVAYSYLRDKKHRDYLIACAIVLSSMVVSTTIDLNYKPETSVYAIIFLVIPTIMAFWYANLTSITKKELILKYGDLVVTRPKQKKGEQENILDDELMWV